MRDQTMCKLPEILGNMNIAGTAFRQYAHYSSFDCVWVETIIPTSFISSWQQTQIVNPQKVHNKQQDISRPQFCCRRVPLPWHLLLQFTLFSRRACIFGVAFDLAVTAEKALAVAHEGKSHHFAQRDCASPFLKLPENCAGNMHSRVVFLKLCSHEVF